MRHKPRQYVELEVVVGVRHHLLVVADRREILEDRGYLHGIAQVVDHLHHLPLLYQEGAVAREPRHRCLLAVDEVHVVEIGDVEPAVDTRDHSFERRVARLHHERRNADRSVLGPVQFMGVVVVHREIAEDPFVDEGEGPRDVTVAVVRERDELRVVGARRDAEGRREDRPPLLPFEETGAVVERLPVGTRQKVRQKGVDRLRAEDDGVVARLHIGDREGRPLHLARQFGDENIGRETFQRDAAERVDDRGPIRPRHRLHVEHERRDEDAFIEPV